MRSSSFLLFYMKRKTNTWAFIPYDLGSEECVDSQVLRQDLVVTDKVLGSLLKLGSSCDTSGQPGR